MMVRLILSIDRREGETAALQTVALAAELQVSMVVFSLPASMLTYLFITLDAPCFVESPMCCDELWQGS